MFISPAATIDITGPSSSGYWVQFTSNVITWTYTSGDPNPISIIVSNSNNSYLNGDFSISQYVDVSTQSTNVTLVTGPGYSVEFVNPANSSDVYATSNSFSVMPPAVPAAAATSSAASSSTSSSPSGTSSGSSTSGTSPSSPSSSTSPNAALRAAVGVNAQGILGVIAACGIASLSTLLL
ncbi:hypothetical protein B0H21DRAFT_764936 [Amylocystis lapponica]|nr:hypothetical protein B0H21DRAFT_764936 [Amylocystis lapponica]